MTLKLCVPDMDSPFILRRIKGVQKQCWSGKRWAKAGSFRGFRTHDIARRALLQMIGLETGWHYDVTQP